MKKLAYALVVALVLVTGCGKDEKKNNEKTTNNDIVFNGNLEDYATKLYEGIAEENLPMMLGNLELTEEDIEYYIGTKDIKWEKAIASESMVGAIAHSVVIIRMSEDATDKDYEDAISKIKENANPRKWVCVEAENVYVERNGNLIVLIMSNDLADTIKTNFKGLK